MKLLELSFLDGGGAGVEGMWRRFEQQASGPYFLSWGWIENWLACLPADARPSLAVLSDKDGPAAEFFISRRHLLRPTGPSRTRFLNATGIPRYDELCAEHNAVLTRGGWACSLGRFVDALPDDWDELVLPALAADRFPGNALGEKLPHHELVVEREVPSPFVDLAKVRASPGGYAALLGSTTRAQLRRAQRACGVVEVEASSDEQHALEIFEELVELHGQRWRKSGQPGAFADPWFYEFHRRLIASRHKHGEIQLLRVRAHGATVGCLYNLVSSGRVLFYQSGLASSDDPHMKPGYVCHAEAVRHNADQGHDVYDFLGGEARYKQNLATDTSRLLWARSRRPLARFAVEDTLRELKRALLSKSI